MKALHFLRSPNRRHGFSLIELLIAMSIGFVVAGLIGGIYLGSQKSSRYQETTARLQENARFATEVMARAIRNAGYNGCGSVSQVSNVVTGGGSNWWLNLSTPILGYEGAVSVFPAEIPIAGAGARIIGTDAFIVVGVDSANELSVTNHNPNSAQISTTQHSIKPGTILVITDCSHTAIFQMSGPTNNNNNATNVVHNTGNSISPGNCYKGLGANCTATEKNYAFQPGASLLQLTSSAFYIGASTTGNQRSLWSVPLANDGSGNITTSAVELIEGVDDMQIEYGEDTDGDGVPNRYVVASAITTWANVVTMRLSLLLSTLENNVSTAAQTYTYNNSSVTASDRRVRRTYTSVFTLRNRSQ